ncbi:MAG: hypothetical protein FJ398_22295 [Verrucomicrobia bacterium]|nr:hypothetical protein [Verrucomicrobiota bacterium]
MAAQHFLGFYSWSGLAVMACWQATTLAPVALAMRWLHERWAWPLTFALPVAWVGGEFLRNLGPLALPTGLLKAPCYDQLWMIQVCDLAGVYGLDFALGMINGLLADAALAWLGSTRALACPDRRLDGRNHRGMQPPYNGSVRGESSPKRNFGRWTAELPPHPSSGHPLPLGGGEGRGEGEVRGETVVGESADHSTQGRVRFPRNKHGLAIPALSTLAVWLFIPAYGWFRLSEAEDTMRPGPVLAVVQPDIPYRIGIANGFDPTVYLEEMIAMSQTALAQPPRPERVVRRK